MKLLRSWATAGRRPVPRRQRLRRDLLRRHQRERHLQRVVLRALADPAARGGDHRARGHDPRALGHLRRLPDPHLGHAGRAQDPGPRARRHGGHQHAGAAEQPLEPDRDRERLRVRGHGLDRGRLRGRELAAPRDRHPDHQPHHDPQLLRPPQRAGGQRRRHLPRLRPRTRCIENNEVAFNTEHGIYHSNSADYPTIRGNRSHHNSGGGIQLNADYSSKCPCGTTVRDGIISFALVENNVIYENGVNGGSAINADGVDDSVFRNNLIYDNHAFGISLFSTDGSHGSSRNKVYNNTIVHGPQRPLGLNIPKSKGNGGSPVGNIVKNNIFYTERADKGAIAVYSTAAGVLTSDYNAVVDRFSTNGGHLRHQHARPVAGLRLRRALVRVHRHRAVRGPGGEGLPAARGLAGHRHRDQPGPGRARRHRRARRARSAWPTTSGATRCPRPWPWGLPRAAARSRRGHRGSPASSRPRRRCRPASRPHPRAWPWC